MKNIKWNLPDNGNTSEMQSQIDSLQNHLDTIAAGNAELEKNLAKFDTLDFVIFTQQKDGLMIEESLYRDNQTYMNQIGIGK